MFTKIVQCIKRDRASVFLEYALLEALVVVVGCATIMPGSLIYNWLHMELVWRLLLISQPVF